jgi:phosphoglycerate dehydrogenase-like enzyme
MKILVAIYGAARVWDLPPRYVDLLRERFPRHTFVTAQNDEETCQAIADAEAAFSSIVRPELRTDAARLRWIHSSAAGVGSLLGPDLRSRGIVLTNSRGVHAGVIAEHVIGVTIMLLRRLHVAVRRQLEGRWAQEELSVPEAARSVRGSRVGVVGLGAIGSAVARAMLALGAEVRAIRRRAGRGGPDGISRVEGPDGLDRLLAWADIIVLTAAHTRETRGLIGARELSLMRRDALLVNVSRGRLVEQAALIDALSRGVIGGAALDVFEHEPLQPDSPLWHMSNAILTPHTSGFRADYWDAVTDLFAENLERFERGAALLNVVDVDLGY